MKRNTLLFLSALFFGAVSMPAQSDLTGNDIVPFADDNLRALVAWHLHSHFDVPLDEPVTVANMELMEIFRGANASSWNIRSLEGLQYATNLKRLYLGNKPIEDLSPLATLHNLEFANIGNTLVTDLTPLVGLESLQQLYVDGALVLDTSPVAELEQRIPNFDASDLYSPLRKFFARVEFYWPLDVTSPDIEFDPYDSTDRKYIADSDIFGRMFYSPDFWPWVYTYSYGWWYCPGETRGDGEMGRSGDRIWLFSDDRQEWLFTSVLWFPYVYSTAEGQWIDLDLPHRVAGMSYFGDTSPPQPFLRHRKVRTVEEFVIARADPNELLAAVDPFADAPELPDPGSIPPAPPTDAIPETPAEMRVAVAFPW